MNGYAGQYLSVDLSKGLIEKRPLSENFLRTNIGGVGFVVSIYLDLIQKKFPANALSPDNPFVIMTGPLSGVKMNGVARWTCGSRSPLTGFWADANIGGFFGAELKFAGYDGIVITGRAERPCCLIIDDDRIELKDASPYWGRDTYETAEALRDSHAEAGGKAFRVFTIGPAGEQGVRFASIVHDKGHMAGRAGLGAVWGSKNFKAIAVRGTGTVPVAHREKLSTLRNELKEAYRNSVYVDALRTFGTASYMDVGIISGDIPMKNWRQTEWDLVDEIGPLAYGEKILAGSATCYGCGVACKREAEVKDGPFAFSKGPGPEYETLATFGALCLNPVIESIGKANELCNRAGMDTISCGATIAFAMECFEKGLITMEDTEGLDLAWGNSEAIVELVRKTARREGFGALIAEGSERLAERIGGPAPDFLTSVKGLEAPMHDPRSYHSFGLAYAVSPRGACHTESPIFPLESGGLFLPDIEDLAGEPAGMESAGKALYTIACQDFGTFLTSCAVFCNLGASPLTASQAVDMVNHVTGFNYTIEEVMRIGRRIWHLERGLSNLFGARAKDDRLPRRLMTPLPDGPSAGSRPDMDLMLKEFYALRRFSDDGVPTREVLEELELKELADLLWPA